MHKLLSLLLIVFIAISCSTEEEPTEQQRPLPTARFAGNWSFDFIGTLCETEAGKYFIELPAPDWVGETDKCDTEVNPILNPQPDSLYCKNGTVFASDPAREDRPYRPNNDFGAIFRQHLLDRETWIFGEDRSFEIERQGYEPLGYECQNDTVVITTFPGFSTYEFEGTWATEERRLNLRVSDTMRVFHIDSLSDSLLWVSPSRNPMNHTFQLLRVE